MSSTKKLATAVTAGIRKHRADHDPETSRNRQHESEDRERPVAGAERTWPSLARAGEPAQKMVRPDPADDDQDQASPTISPAPIGTAVKTSAIKLQSDRIEHRWFSTESQGAAMSGQGAFARRPIGPYWHDGVTAGTRGLHARPGDADR